MRARAAAGRVGREYGTGGRMSSTLDEFNIELWQESWEYLNTDNNTIAIAKKVQKLVNEDWKPDAIKQHVLQQLGKHREPFAIRCELAAKYLHATKRA